MKKLKLKELPQTWTQTCLDPWFLSSCQSIMESYILVFSQHYLNTLGLCVCVYRERRKMSFQLLTNIQFNMKYFVYIISFNIHKNPMKCHTHPHFTGEETETQKARVKIQVHIILNSKFIISVLIYYSLPMMKECYFIPCLFQ